MSIPNKALVEAHSDEKLAKLHVVLLMMMADFKEICAKHDITWIAMYGTAIGALRHKGFIPWDDDIDICMPRADHDKLCQIVKREYAEKYTIVNAQNCPKYPMMTTRFILKGTEFRDANLETMDFDSGIFLDLFPLDVMADDEKAFKKQAWRAWLYNKLGIARDVAHPYIADRGLVSKLLRVATKTAYYTLNLPGLKHVNWPALSLKWSSMYEGQTTKRLGYVCDTNRFTCLYDVEDLFPIKEVPFEDMTIPVAHHAEKLLSDYYGDWMCPPPDDLKHEHYPNILKFGPYEPKDDC